MATQQLNAYVYDKASVREAARSLLDLKNIDRVLYAMKANFNADLLRELDNEGVDFECVSPGEVEWLISATHRAVRYTGSLVVGPAGPVSIANDHAMRCG